MNRGKRGGEREEQHSIEGDCHTSPHSGKRGVCRAAIGGIGAAGYQEGRRRGERTTDVKEEGEKRDFSKKVGIRHGMCRQLGLP